jgi:propanol-preferring alcohol dehydrogenase
MLRKRGNLVMIGLSGGALDLNLPLVPLRSFTLTGSYTGTFVDLTNLVAIAKYGKIRSVISRKFKLEQANEALEELKTEKIIGRAVLNPA